MHGLEFHLTLNGSLMEALLVAVGAVGAWTIAYGLGWLYRRLSPPPSTMVYFSPRGGCTKAIVAELQAARSEILVMAYSFTHDPIVDAMIAAFKRKVKVQVILDKDNEVATYSDLVRIMNFGVPTLIDANHAIAHNKVIIIDRKVVITGSFNFTAQAEANNAENLLIIKHQPPVVNRYIRNFEEHQNHSRAPQPRAESGTTDKGKRTAA